MGDGLIIKRESRLEVVYSRFDTFTSVSNGAKLDCVHGKIPIKHIGGEIKWGLQLDVPIRCRFLTNAIDTADCANIEETQPTFIVFDTINKLDITSTA